MPTTINASNTTGGAVVTGDGSGILELQSGGVTGITVNGANVTVAGTLTATGGSQTPLVVGGTPSVGAQIRLGEATANGTNFVAVKAADNLAANTTFTLPTADGTNGQYLRTDGAGNLSFATVPVTSPAGTTGQVQINNAGAFGAVASGTSGQVLTSNGAGVAPSFATPNYTPGAFGQFSIVGINAESPQFFTASVADMTSNGGWPSAQIPTFNSTATNYISSTGSGAGGSICYSSFYGCWFLLGNDSNNEGAIYVSRNGLNWSMLIRQLRTVTGLSAVNSFSLISVDDSDGRLFIGVLDNTNGQGFFGYTAGTNWTSWTFTSLWGNGNGAIYELYYIDTGSVSTSATVISVSDGVGTFTIRTCNAGGTTFTTRATNSSFGGRVVYHRQSGYGLSLRDNVSVCAFFTNNNAQTGWTVNTSMGVSVGNTGAMAVGNGVFASIDALQRIIYSTTGSGTWTTGSVVASGTVNALFWNGVSWVATTSTGISVNSNTIPTGAWTRIYQAGLSRASNFGTRQRYI